MMVMPARKVPVMTLPAQLLEQEGPDVGLLFDQQPGRLAVTVTRLGLYTQEHGSVTCLCRLQGGSELERMRGYNAVAAVPCRQQGSRVAGVRLDVVQGGIIDKVPEPVLVFARTVIACPGPPDREAVVAEHVEYADGGMSSAEQVRPLRYAGTDQKATVGAALDRQPFRPRVVLVDQMLGTGDEVIEHVLFAAEDATFVPGLAVFDAAAQVGEHECAASLEPGKPAG